MMPYTRAVCECLQVFVVPIILSNPSLASFLDSHVKYLLDLFFFLMILNLDERASLDRIQIEQIGIRQLQLHCSTANYAPLQKLAFWDGLVAMYEKVTIIHY